MTRVATPDAVLADFDRGRLDTHGHEYRLTRRGDEFWAELPDPLWFQDRSAEKPALPPRFEARVVMTTGSHHLQNFWIRRPSGGSVYRDSPDNGAYVQIPFAWIIEARRWVPVEDSFLSPPSTEPEPIAVWNTSCHLCHSVAPSPGFADGKFETRVVEFGIACEACHGPASLHVARHRNPLRRYLAYGADAPRDDVAIVNAERLGAQRGAEVCGQCHSFSRVVDVPKWQRSGVDYRLGEPLATAKALLRHSTAPSDPQLLAQLAEEPNALVGRFWPDGTIRVAGRELNGLVESACYQRGELDCLSCHSLHSYESRDDQLAKGGGSNAACVACHAEEGRDLPAHTRHAPDSPGSECMNCHMPYTTYGLFKAIRSHRVDNPRVASAAHGGRPNACNLCHFDRTLAWADAELQRGWHTQPAALGEGDVEIAAGVQWALAGDAAQRAIAAWHFGWSTARKASGGDWAALYLAVLLEDPYAAVRRVAGLSLAKVPGFADFEFDSLAPPEVRAQKSREAAERWIRTLRIEALRAPSELLLTPEGAVDEERYLRLLDARNQTPIRIIE
jgi:hypothetical protein